MRRESLFVTILGGKTISSHIHYMYCINIKRVHIMNKEFRIEVFFRIYPINIKQRNSAQASQLASESY